MTHIIQKLSFGFVFRIGRQTSMQLGLGLFLSGNVIEKSQHSFQLVIGIKKEKSLVFHLDEGSVLSTHPVLKIYGFTICKHAINHRAEVGLIIRMNFFDPIGKAVPHLLSSVAKELLVAAAIG